MEILRDAAIIIFALLVWAVGIWGMEKSWKREARRAANPPASAAATDERVQNS